jgi:hypothetical protein
MPVYEPEIGVAPVSLARAVPVGVVLTTMDPERPPSEDVCRFRTMALLLRNWDMS